MKNNNYLFIILSLIVLYSCKDNVIVDPPAVDKEYFPAKTGAKFTYSLTIDSNLVLSGAKISDIIGLQSISGTEYFIQIDSIIIERALTLDTAYFRKSNTGVFYYTDTTGLGQLIPDTLRNALRIDNESRLLFFPLRLNQTWPVYQIDITVGGIPVFSPVKTNAKISGKEQLTMAIRDSQYTIDVFKIEYKVEVQLDPQGASESFYAYGYIAENIGFVKWEGESFVINLIRGGRLDLSLTSTYMLEELRNYFIP
ncbi:Hypothetical protein IALB_2353 [Ignavibacterium album JCM 16511]|uniref:Uncharacterized protein n=1 Tax=Ignavibacterium album (strain DSM 19864 / JCM 16511 / NBRC 101810 / Mat9-16) TaxID=945713 RepID=I0AM49_IGNAJ|nr:hypothetical protein [Ignavibacterium album]AFH50056.1 Hypothetical protein IALB_2353 [Ignavibacterium album JCM 16511]